MADSFILLRSLPDKRTVRRHRRCAQTEVVKYLPVSANLVNQPGHGFTGVNRIQQNTFVTRQQFNGFQPAGIRHAVFRQNSCPTAQSVPVFQYQTAVPVRFAV